MRIKTYTTICLACGYRGDIKNQWWNFPGSSVVKASPSNAGGTGLIIDRAAKIPHALWPKNQSIKQKQCCNKFNKDFKNATRFKNNNNNLIKKKKKRKPNSGNH